MRADHLLESLSPIFSPDFESVRDVYNHEINSWGAEGWYKNNILHRDNDLPALIWPNGDQFWYKEGKLHRDNNLPAIIKHDGRKHYFINGEDVNAEEQDDD